MSSKKKNARAEKPASPRSEQPKKPVEKPKRKKKHTLRKILFLLFLLLVAHLIYLYLTAEPEQNPESAPAAAAAGTWDEAYALPAEVEGDEILRHTGFTLSYNEQYEEPDWAAYLLTREEVGGDLERTNNFHPDTSVSTGSASLEDYRASGYDRGHLVPAADLKWDSQAMDDSFYLSNMTPQVPEFNRGIWASLEAMVRTFANDYGAVYVATGPVLQTEGPFKTIGPNKVAVPKHFYKAILYWDGTNARSIAFYLPNSGSNLAVTEYVLTVDALEEKTGLDFFASVPSEVQDKAESSYDLADWNFTEFAPGNAPMPVPGIGATSSPAAVAGGASGEKAKNGNAALFVEIISVMGKELQKEIKSAVSRVL